MQFNPSSGRQIIHQMGPAIRIQLATLSSQTALPREKRNALFYLSMRVRESVEIAFTAWRPISSLTENARAYFAESCATAAFRTALLVEDADAFLAELERVLDGLIDSRGPRGT